MNLLPQTATKQNKKLCKMSLPFSAVTFLQLCDTFDDGDQDAI